MKFDAFGTSKHEERKSLSNFFLLYLSVHWGDLIQQIKKKSVTYTLRMQYVLKQRRQRSVFPEVKICVGRCFIKIKSTHKWLEFLRKTLNSANRSTSKTYLIESENAPSTESVATTRLYGFWQPQKINRTSMLAFQRPIKVFAITLRPRLLY